MLELCYSKALVEELLETPWSLPRKKSQAIIGARYMNKVQRIDMLIQVCPEYHRNKQKKMHEKAFPKICKNMGKYLNRLLGKKKE